MPTCWGLPDISKLYYILMVAAGEAGLNRSHLHAHDEFLAKLGSTRHIPPVPHRGQRFVGK